MIENIEKIDNVKINEALSENQAEHILNVSFLKIKNPWREISVMGFVFTILMFLGL